MKKPIVLTLLVLLSFSVLGPYPIFSVLQSNIRFHISLLINHEESTVGLVRVPSVVDGKVLTIDSSKNEFLLNGKLFDIVYKIDSANVTYFYCKADFKEMNLYEWYGNIQQEINGSHLPINNRTKIFLKSVLHDFLVPELEFSTIQRLSIGKLIEFIDLVDFHYKSRVVTLFPIPPEA